ncbi:hypothetical protein [Virgibacillus sp. CM-4]|nr:hypothetical protein [Virgibacillus sp. CM-4]
MTKFTRFFTYAFSTVILSGFFLLIFGLMLAGIQFIFGFIF